MKVILFGIGAVGVILFERLYLAGADIICILDNDPQKAGTSHYGTPILPPTALKGMKLKGVSILICTEREGCYEEICAQLQTLGLRENIDFCDGTKRFAPLNSMGLVSSCAQDLERKSAPFFEAEAASGGPETDDASDSPAGPAASGVLIHKSHAPDERIIEMPGAKRIFRVYSGQKAGIMADVFKRLSESSLLGSFLPGMKKTRPLWQEAPPCLLFEMNYLEPVSYAPEWPPAMFKDYVLWMLDFMAGLDKAGLAVDRPHPHKSTFAGGGFLFTDPGALRVRPMNSQDFLYFANSHIMPLILMTKRRHDRACQYLKNPAAPCVFADVRGHLDADEAAAWLDLQTQCGLLPAVGRAGDMCARLADYVRPMDFNFALEIWRGYHQKAFESSSMNEKLHNVLALAGQSGARSIIDLAGNTGWYALALCAKADYVVSVDYENGPSDDAYRLIRAQGVKNVVPLCFNLLSPLPAYLNDLALDPSGGVRPERRAAQKRLRCDLALALAVIHHLAFSQRLDFTEIIDLLRQWTRRWLIVEYIDADDQHLPQQRADDFAWYTRENFEKALLKHFKIAAVRPSNSPTRSLYLCELGKR
ncbi:hypothetical protein LJC15_02970 [Desulfovibrio sp. OttesenSCG-928-G11]|nr:hypothetical protein [Desulfovibrio sp. OttesenSCG-928-G11]